jgi:hypothetical protein
MYQLAADLAKAVISLKSLKRLKAVWSCKDLRTSNHVAPRERFFAPLMKSPGFEKMHFWKVYLLDMDATRLRADFIPGTRYNLAIVL